MLIVRAEQLNTLKASAHERFIDNMVAYLLQSYPALTDCAQGPTLVALVTTAIEHAANAYGLVAQQDAARYLDLCASYGWQFDTVDQNQWMAHVFLDSTVSSPSDRLALLLDMCVVRTAQENHTRALADLFGIVAPVSRGAAAVPAKDGVLGTLAAPRSSPGTLVQACPLRLKSALEVMVCDTTGVPVAGIAVAIAKDASEVRMKTSSTGTVRLEGLMPGTYTLSLPCLDADTWKANGEDNLPGHENNEPEPDWAQSAPAHPRPIQRQVEEGDCVSSLALTHGLLPETLWQANDAVRERGHALNILFPGNSNDLNEGPADTLVIPPVRPKNMVVSTGMRYRLCHVGLPEYLRIQFLDADGGARARVPYLLMLEGECGSLLSVEGVTDADGRLAEPLPTNAKLGSVTLCKGSLHRTIELGIGYLDPISTIAGVQDRLANLGYGCGNDDGKIGDATRWALQRFQAAHGLRVSATIDDATKAALGKLHLG